MMKPLSLLLFFSVLAGCSNDNLLIGIEHGDRIEVTAIDESNQQVTLLWTRAEIGTEKVEFSKIKNMLIADFRNYMQSQEDTISLGDTFYCSIAQTVTGDSIVFLVKSVEEN